MLFLCFNATAQVAFWSDDVTNIYNQVKESKAVKKTRAFAWNLDKQVMVNNKPNGSMANKDSSVSFYNGNCQLMNVKNYSWNFASSSYYLSTETNYMFPNANTVEATYYNYTFLGTVLSSTKLNMYFNTNNTEDSTIGFNWQGGNFVPCIKNKYFYSSGFAMPDSFIALSLDVPSNTLYPTSSYKRNFDVNGLEIKFINYTNTNITTPTWIRNTKTVTSNSALAQVKTNSVWVNNNWENTKKFNLAFLPTGDVRHVISYNWQTASTWQMNDSSYNYYTANNNLDSVKLYSYAVSTPVLSNIKHNVFDANGNMTAKWEYKLSNGTFYPKAQFNNIYTNCKPTAMNDVSEAKNQLSIYPNPATENQSITIETPFANGFDVVISNLAGQVIVTRKSNAKTITEPLTATTGIYIVQCIGDNQQIITKKLVIQ
jgi:hypothetical protein